MAELQKKLHPIVDSMNNAIKIFLVKMKNLIFRLNSVRVAF